MSVCDRDREKREMEILKRARDEKRVLLLTSHSN